LIKNCKNEILFTKKVQSCAVELGYNVTKGTEHFVSLYTSVVITDKYKVTVDSEELIGTTECLT